MRNVNRLLRAFVIALAAATVALIAVVVAVAEPAPQPGSSRLLESWADQIHGWRFAGARDAHGFFPSIQASDDGGRSWHTVYRSSLFGTVGTILRTSPAAGLATVANGARARTIVTLDGGRHWQRLARRFFWPAGYRADGAGSDLFVLGNPSGGATQTTLYRVTNWPTIRPRLHAEASNPGGFSLLRMVPGGIAALEQPEGTSGPPFRLLIDRNGSVRIVSPSPITTQEAVDCGVRSFTAAWPTLILVTGWATAGPKACDNQQTAVVYTSDNGGQNWSLTGTPPTATR